jgi:deoxycytidine triphosphate deaminase
LPLADEFEPAEPPSRPRPGAPWPQSSEEAKERFSQWDETDPFPGIEPALLNSAHVEQYALATGMVYPFYPDRLKSASYPIAIAGDVVYWDNRDRMRTIDLRKGATERFRLRRNSIAYVTLEPVFRLPQYIAIRFNLKIDNVYRGLLLGTGPLVDPGWAGRLSFPLHNLTTNDYWFDAGEEIIWVEFTKVSPLDRWKPEKATPAAPPGTYRPYPDVKRGGTVKTRLTAAAPHQTIRSSLEEAYDRAEKAAALTNRIQVWGATALLVGLATLVALVVDVLAFRSNATKNVPTQTVTTVTVRGATAGQVQALRADIKKLQKEIDRLRAQLGLP